MKESKIFIHKMPSMTYAMSRSDSMHSTKISFSNDLCPKLYQAKYNSLCEHE